MTSCKISEENATNSCKKVMNPWKNKWNCEKCLECLEKNNEKPNENIVYKEKKLVSSKISSTSSKQGEQSMN